MRTPLEYLIESGHGEPLTADRVDGFVSRPGPRLLVFTGDPVQRPEAQDVAVVAHELLRERPSLAVGVVSFSEEAAVRPRFKVDVVPSVVFIKDGRPISTVARLQDWAVYARAASVVFGREERAR